MTHMSKITVTCRKCIQERQFEPVEFTATAEMTFTDLDMPPMIERGCAQARRKAIAVVEECFDEWLRAKEAACQDQEKP